MACTISNTCFLEHIRPAAVLRPFVFTHFCFNTLWLAAFYYTNLSFLMGISFLIYAFLIYNGFSGMQIRYKTRAGCMTLADTAPNITRSNELINNGTANTVLKILKKTQRNKMNSHNIGCMYYSKQTMQQ